MSARQTVEAGLGVRSGAVEAVDVVHAGRLPKETFISLAVFVVAWLA